MARFAWGPSWTHGATQHVMIQLIPAATAPNSCSRPILRMITSFIMREIRGMVIELPGDPAMPFARDPRWVLLAETGEYLDARPTPRAGR